VNPVLLSLLRLFRRWLDWGWALLVAQGAHGKV
jgi:hypothetical protein